MNNSSTVPPNRVKFLSSDEPVFRLMYLILVSIATACGNVLVLVAVLRFKSLRRTTNVMLGSLALADLLIGIVTVPLYIVWTINPVVFDRSSFMCGFVLLSCLLMVTASQISLLCLSVEQFFAVCYPFQHRDFLIRYPWFHKVTVGITWIISFVTTSLSSFAFNTSAITCNYYGAFNKTFLFVASLVGIFLPFIALIILNVKVLCVVRDHDKRRRISSDSEKSSFSPSSSSRMEVTSETKGEELCGDKSQTRKIMVCSSWNFCTRLRRSINDKKERHSSVLVDDYSETFYESLKQNSSPSTDSTHDTSPKSPHNSQATSDKASESWRANYFSRDGCFFWEVPHQDTPNRDDFKISKNVAPENNRRLSFAHNSLDSILDQVTATSGTSSRDGSPIKEKRNENHFTYNTPNINRRRRKNGFQGCPNTEEEEYTSMESTTDDLETFDIATETLALTEMTKMHNNNDCNSVRQYETLTAHLQNISAQTVETAITHSYSDSLALADQCHTKNNTFFNLGKTDERTESKKDNCQSSSALHLLKKEAVVEHEQTHEYLYELKDFSRRVRSYSDSRYRRAPARYPNPKTSLYSLSQTRRPKHKSSLVSQLARRTSSVLSVGFFRGRMESTGSEIANPARQVSDRVARMVALVCASFILAWLPLFVVIFINTFCVECNLVYYLNAVVMVAFTKSVSNPIIYALCHVSFRRAYSKVLASLCFVRGATLVRS